MSQPIPADQNASPDLDPLLAFFEEHLSGSNPGTGDGTALPENPAKFAQPGESAETVELAESRDAVPSDLRQRLDQVERLVERSLIEIAALRSDLATLVTAVEDIKKRQTRRDAPLPSPAPPVKRMSGGRATLAAVALLTFAMLGWGLTAMVSNDRPELPPIESKTPVPAAVPAPVVEAAPPQIEVGDVVAPDDSPPRRASPITTAYVGTLTIDASPDGEVFLDRESVGRTPLRLEKLRAGSHLIWIEREGYRRWTRVVPVTADRISRVSATLDPISR